MLRIAADQVSVFFAFHEKYTQELVKDSLRLITYRNRAENDFVINFSDFVSGCFSTDCYSKYLPEFDTDTFKEVKYFLEEAVVSGKIVEDYWKSFCDTLMLFGIESCLLSIWLNSFMRSSFEDSCRGLVGISDIGDLRSKLNRALGFIGKVNVFRIIPTMPVRLIDTLMRNDKMIVTNRYSGEYPTQDKALEVLGWLMHKYPSVRSLNIDDIFSSLSEESCRKDEYSLYMFRLLEELMRYDSESAEDSSAKLRFPLFTVKEDV